MDYGDLKLHGYSHFNDPEMFKYLKWYYRFPMVPYETVYYPAWKYPVGVALIRLTQRLIKKKYIPFKTKAGNCDAWKGVDLNTDKWHNDHIEGSNTAFLMYLSNQSGETGGGIQFRELGVNKVHTIYPKKYDIIAIDQADKFQHRVLPLKKPINRYIANIEFDILES